MSERRGLEEAVRRLEAAIPPRVFTPEELERVPVTHCASCGGPFEPFAFGTSYGPYMHVPRWKVNGYVHDACQKRDLAALRARNP